MRPVTVLRASTSQLLITYLHILMAVLIKGDKLIKQKFNSDENG